MNVMNLMLPARSPIRNAYAERFVRTINEECLDRIILIGYCPLRRALDQFCDHYLANSLTGVSVTNTPPTAWGVLPSRTATHSACPLRFPSG